MQLWNSSRTSMIDSLITRQGGGSAKPQTASFRSTSSITDPTQVRVLDLGVKQATGSVVYLNGVEVGRTNMPTGTITATSPAAGYLSGDAETAPTGSSCRATCCGPAPT